MSFIRKNIWSLYLLILLIGTFIFAVVLVLKWQDIKQQHISQHRYSAALVSNTTNSLLSKFETTLDVLERDLVKNDAYKDDAKAHRILSSLLAFNRDIVLYGLSTTDGQIYLSSGDVDLSKLPNLRRQERSRRSYEYTMTVDKLVVGRTYFLASFDNWFLPIRMAIRDSDGKVLLMLSTGLRLDGETLFLGKKLHYGAESEVSLLRSFDNYPQYISADNLDYKRYDQPYDDQEQLLFYQQLESRYGQSIEQIKASGAVYDYSIETPESHYYASAVYIPRYELWVIAKTPMSFIKKQFLSSLFIFSVFFIIINSILFYAFRMVANAERKRNQSLLKQATHDPLTGLANRNYLYSSIPNWLASPEQAFSVLYIDMDRFKNINDSFGHECGDKVLRQMSARLKQKVPRNCDVIRYGGDEFIIIMPGTNRSYIQEQAQLIIDSLSLPYVFEGSSFILSASVGVAHYPSHGKSLDSLLAASDIAMYEAKKHRNQICFFDSPMQEAYREMQNIEQKLRSAIDSDEIFMVFQPQINPDGNCDGVEALARWNSPELGFVQPDRFIKAAEFSGLMPRLGKIIIELSIKGIASLRESIDTKIHLSINISVSQFMQEDFISHLSSTVERYQFDASRVSLEITENLFIEDLDYLLPKFHSLNEMGFHISIDDFGTGYSSLSMLREIPAVELKIDKSFVDGILFDEEARQMIKNIIAIGKNYKMSLVAEGVESKEQADLLKEYGCDRFQGYLYAKPLPMTELIRFLQEEQAEA